MARRAAPNPRRIVMPPDRMSRENKAKRPVPPTTVTPHDLALIAGRLYQTCGASWLAAQELVVVVPRGYLLVDALAAVGCGRCEICDEWATELTDGYCAEHAAWFRARVASHSRRAESNRAFYVRNSPREAQEAAA